MLTDACRRSFLYPSEEFAVIPSSRRNLLAPPRQRFPPSHILLSKTQRLQRHSLEASCDKLSLHHAPPLLPKVPHTTPLSCAVVGKCRLFSSLNQFGR